MAGNKSSKKTALENFKDQITNGQSGLDWEAMAVPLDKNNKQLRETTTTPLIDPQLSDFIKTRVKNEKS